METNFSYEALFNGTDDLIWSVSRMYTLLAANKKYLETIKAATGNELMAGDTLFSKEATSEEIAKWKSYYRRGLGGEKFSVNEQINIRDTGKYLIFKISFNPIYTNDGTVMYVACYGKDITAEIITLADLKASQQKLSRIMDSSLDMICTVDEKGYYVSVSAASERLLGYKPEELIGTLQIDHIYPPDYERTVHAKKSIIETEYLTNFENRYVHKNGSIVPLVWTSRWSPVEKLRYGVARNATERIKAEQIIKDSEKKYKALFQNNPAPMIIWDIATLQIVDCNEEALLKYGYSRDEFLSLNIRQIRPAEDIPLIEAVSKNEDLYGNTHKQLWRHQKKSGEIMIMNLTGHIIDYNGRKSAMVMVIDVTEMTKAEEELRNSETMLAEAQRLAKTGSWNYDFRFEKLNWSDELYHVFGVDTDFLKEKNGSVLSLIDDADRKRVAALINGIYETGASYHTEYGIQTPAGQKRVIEESAHGKKDSDGKLINLLGTVQDITERKLIEIQLKELNESLQEQKKALEVSNNELEQFAYIASHDLQEPLRMITGFVNLLQTKYGEMLDEKGRSYINFVVDGTQRMRDLISDLLEYSKIGHIDEPMEPVDLNSLIEEIKILFCNQIEQYNAVINTVSLPVINAHPSPVRQVFQNLIANALKYKKKNVAPVINIQCVSSNDYLTFSINDNGIGIDEKYFEKIFVIFQRLHSKREYSGTGIGLSITKKIIESLGGKIWVESAIDKGSTFYFTLPKG